MSDHLMISTRKGLFFLDRMADGWRLAGNAFLGSPVVNAMKDGRDGTLYATLNLGHFGAKLHRSTDNGRTWDEVAMPAHARQEEDADAPSVVQIWTMETDGRSAPGGLWAGTIPGGLFHSADGGGSWTLNDSLWSHPTREKWMGGGYDKPGIHSICVDPRNADHISVGVSVGGVWRSRDGGKSWDGATRGMTATYVPPDIAELPEVQDPHRMVQCAADPDSFWVQHHCGIFRSADGLETWSTITPEPCPAFGFAVAGHPQDPLTAWFVPAVKDEFRFPRDGRFVVSRTQDGGESFEVMSQGLPQETSYDLVYRHGLAVDATGRRLAMGSTTGGGWVSEDSGESWAALPARLPPVYAVGFV